MQGRDENQHTEGDREALRLYRSLVSQREAGTLPAAASLGGETMRMPRVRLAQDIDLSKAKPGCSACGGDGVAGHRTLPGDGAEAQVPIVCRCVVEAGGVRADAFDRMRGRAG